MLTTNRFALLEEEEEEHDTQAETFLTPHDHLTYCEAVTQRRPKNKRDVATPSSNKEMDSDPALAELDQRLALLQEEVRRLSQRRAAIRQRTTRSPEHHPSTQACEQGRLPCHQSQPVPVSHGALSATELLQFVATQLQNISAVLAANLPK